MKKTIILTSFVAAVIACFALSTISYAQPYGAGLYDENVPYGNQTSLTIGTSGDINISITPTLSGTLSTGTSTVTVSTTDVKGYSLYIRALSDTNMNNLGTLLPASANTYPSSTGLVMDTWGYNTDASSNFAGISLTDTLIRSISTPAKAGDVTNVKYGLRLDFAKPAGKYTAHVVYTAVPQPN